MGGVNRKLSSNPASQIQIDLRGKMSERIRGFTEDEAMLILRHAAEETDPVRRWIPLLCAYSGARLCEVCQLRKQDVFEHEGIWCIKFVPEAGSLKNASSELFSMLGADRFGNRGGTGTKAISRWVLPVGITDERISPSHSWRHRFKTLGRRHGLMTDIVNAMTGHRRKTVADAYGEFPMAALYRELQKIPDALAPFAAERRSQQGVVTKKTNFEQHAHCTRPRRTVQTADIGDRPFNFVAAC